MEKWSKGGLEASEDEKSEMVEHKDGCVAFADQWLAGMNLSYIRNCVINFDF